MSDENITFETSQTPDDEGLFETTIRVKEYGDGAIVCFTHEAREVDSWRRAAEAKGETLTEWLIRLAENAACDWERGL